MAIAATLQKSKKQNFNQSVKRHWLCSIRATFEKLKNLEGENVFLKVEEVLVGERGGCAVLVVLVEFA